MSGIINGVIVREQLKRFWPVAALPTAFYLLLAGFGLQVERGSNYGQAIVDVFLNIITMRNQAIWASVFIIPLFAVVCVMSFYNTPKAATFFYSLPINRSQLILSNALAGIILTLLPLVVLFGLLMIPIYLPLDPDPLRRFGVGFMHVRFPEEIFSDWVALGSRVNTFGVVGAFILRLAIAKLFYFGLFWLAFTVTGHRIVGILLAVALPLIPAVGTALAQWLATIYLDGFVLGWHDEIFFATYGTPMLGRIFAWRWSGYEFLTLRYLLYTIATVGFFALSFVVGRVRKHEYVGNSVMFAPVKNVLVFIVSCIGAAFVGGILQVSTQTVSGFYAGFVLGFALGFVIAQMIAEKAFHVWHKLRYLAHFSAAFITIFVGIWLFFQFGMGWWVNFVPEKEDVSGVFINHMIGGDVSDWPFMEDPEIIALTIEAHRAILNERGQNPNRPFLPLRYTILDPSIRWASMPITYRMHDGSIIRRHYSVTGEFFANSILYDLFMDERVIFSGHTSLEVPSLITHIQIEYRAELSEDDTELSFWQSEWITIHEEEQVQELAAAIRQDLIARAIVQMQQRTQPITEDDFVETWREPVLSITIGTRSDLRFDHVWLQGSEFENTARFLHEWGYFD